MKKFNILFLGGGKRVELVKNFKKIESKFKLNINCYTYEINKDNPFFLVGKVIIGKRWDDPLVLDDIEKKVKKFKIKLILANSDPATLILSKLKNNKFLGSKIITSDYTYSKLCYDKLLIEKCLSKSKEILLIPKISNKFPKFIKPRFGSGSLFSKKIENKSELSKINSLIEKKKYLIQEFINGKEITVDVYINKFGQFVGLICRRRISVSHGESVVTETFLNSKIKKIIINILKTLNFSLIGPLTFQFIERKKKYYFLEINPRLSGGINASIASGLDVPSLLIGEILNKKKKSFNFKKKKLFKYFKEIII